MNAQEPWKVLARSECPLMSPEADYEIAGFFGNVVFSCGVLIEDDIIKLYYGAADTCIAYAEISLNDIFKNLQGSM